MKILGRPELLSDCFTLPIPEPIYFPGVLRLNPGIIDLTANASPTDLAWIW